MGPGHYQRTGFIPDEYADVPGRVGVLLSAEEGHVLLGEVLRLPGHRVSVPDQVDGSLSHYVGARATAGRHDKSGVRLRTELCHISEYAQTSYGPVVEASTPVRADDGLSHLRRSAYGVLDRVEGGNPSDIGSLS